MENSTSLQQSKNDSKNWTTLFRSFKRLYTLLPELMVQDYEGFMSEDDFDCIFEYSDMCDKHCFDAVDDYMKFNDTLDNFEESYCGEWKSEDDFVRHIVEECYNLELKIAEYLLNKLNMKQKMRGSLVNYFDYDTYGREVFMCDYSTGSNGHVFRRI